MKKPIISLILIFFASALAVGFTVSYYNDIESSRDNILVAGTLDLQVDNQSYYNGHVCEGDTWQCEPWADRVVSFEQGEKKNGGTVPLERSNPSKALGQAENNDTFNFVSLGMGLGFGGELVLGFDNMILNGDGPDFEIIETSFGSPGCQAYPEKADIWVSQYGEVWDHLGEICLDASLDIDGGGMNLPWIKFVKIKDVSDPDDFSNGNADGYDVDGVRALHCGTYPDLAGQECDGTWNLTDLSDEKFFNFQDIKPGDQGKSIISLHVQENDGWACAIIDNMQNDDNGCEEPEANEGGDSTCGEGQGELAQNLYFFAWADDGDSFYEPDEGEMPLFTNVKGPASDVFDGKAYSIADSTTGAPLSASSTYYLGLAWCAGEMSVNQSTGNVSCDPAGMGNDCQGDSLTADLHFYTEQFRNNPNFVCEFQE